MQSEILKELAQSEFEKSHIIDQSQFLGLEKAEWTRLQRWYEDPRTGGGVRTYDKDALDRVRSYASEVGEGCVPIIRDNAFVKVQFYIVPTVSVQNSEQVLSVNCDEQNNVVEPPGSRPQTSSFKSLRRFCARVIPRMRKTTSTLNLLPNE